MATTGFWPVRGKLKDIIDYAENPDKTTAREYRDDDLYDALRYVENDDKTDKKMFVTALNCSKSAAYEQMTAVKRKYGERGKIIYNPEEKQQIIPNMQEPIISEEQWLQVQEIRKNRIRPTTTGRTSLFAGKVFCADCSSKLHFCAAKSLRPDQEFYRCANYKAGRGECKIHYIRNVVLERIVLEAISDFVDFVRCYEPVFLYMLAKKHDILHQMEYRKLKQFIEYGEKRIKDLDKLISGAYSDYKLGEIEEKRYRRLMKEYESEQYDLEPQVEKSKKELETFDQRSVDLRLLLKTVREQTDVKELTPALVNSLIERIEVHNNDKYDCHCHVKVDIYFTVVGMMNVPDEKEIQAMMEEMKNNPKSLKLVS